MIYLKYLLLASKYIYLYCLLCLILILYLMWYHSLSSMSFTFVKLDLSISNVCIAQWVTNIPFLTFATTRQGSWSQSFPPEDLTSSIVECCLLAVKTWSVWLCVFLSVTVQMHLLMSWCGNIILFAIRQWCDKVYYSRLIIITNCVRNFSENTWREYYLGALGVVWRIMLKGISKECSLRM